MPSSSSCTPTQGSTVAKAAQTEAADPPRAVSALNGAATLYYVCHANNKMSES